MKFINRKLMNTNNTSFLALTNPSISLLFILPLFPFSFDGLHHNPPPAPPPKETEEAATTMYQSSPSPSSTEERKGDPRFYLLSAFFFSCIVTGGLFLGLYIFLPPDETQPWYPIPGLILVAIPWIFWFLTYIYRCIRPKNAQIIFANPSQDPHLVNPRCIPLMMFKNIALKSILVMTVEAMYILKVLL